jgi:hypothetical protein
MGPRDIFLALRDAYIGSWIALSTHTLYRIKRKAHPRNGPEAVSNLIMLRRVLAKANTNVLAPIMCSGLSLIAQHFVYSKVRMHRIGLAVRGMYVAICFHHHEGDASFPELDCGDVYSSTQLACLMQPSMDIKLNTDSCRHIRRTIYEC